MTSATPAAGTPDPRRFDASMDAGGASISDPPPDDGADGQRGPGARAAAWLAPTPSELVALAVLLLGAVVATLVWWYGSVTAPVGPIAAATAGTPFGDGRGDDPEAGASDSADADHHPPEPDAVASDPGTGSDVGAASTAGPVLVHVSGAVGRPGLVTLSAGARVGDAVEVAGGLTEDADGDRINLARVLVDGEQVHVPVEGEELSPAAAGDPGAAAAAGAAPGGGGLDPEGRIDLNRAGAAELETLPGIGPARATAIVDHREQHGPFGVPGDLRAVSGIGEATFQNLAPLIVVR